MKKVTAFVGSARKGNTYDAVVQFLGNLQAMGDIETEIVRLGDYHLGVCRGCRVCFEKGEEKCPHKDDRDVLIEKMMASDGVVFASPNYSFQVSGMLKVFLDRLGFAFHRPRFFGKTYTSIVTQGMYGGNKLVDYLDFVGSALGFNTVKGSCLMMLLPMTEKQQQKMDRALAAQAKRYYAKTAPAGLSGAVVDLPVVLQDGPNEDEARARRQQSRPQVLCGQGLVRIRLLLSRSPGDPEEGNR